MLMSSCIWMSCFFMSWRRGLISLFGDALKYTLLHCLTGVTLALFPAGLAKVRLATNNDKNSKLQRKPEETQIIVGIWSKSNLTVVNYITDWWKSGCDSSFVQQGVCVIDFGARHFSCFLNVEQSSLLYWLFHQMMTSSKKEDRKRKIYTSLKVFIQIRMHGPFV